MFFLSSVLTFIQDRMVPMVIQYGVSKKLLNQGGHLFVSIYSSFTHGQDVTLAQHLME